MASVYAFLACLCLTAFVHGAQLWHVKIPELKFSREDVQRLGPGTVYEKRSGNSGRDVKPVFLKVVKMKRKIAVADANEACRIFNGTLADLREIPEDVSLRHKLFFEDAATAVFARSEYEYAKYNHQTDRTGQIYSFEKLVTKSSEVLCAMSSSSRIHCQNGFHLVHDSCIHMVMRTQQFYFNECMIYCHDRNSQVIIVDNDAITSFVKNKGLTVYYETPGMTQVEADLPDQRIAYWTSHRLPAAMDSMDRRTRMRSLYNLDGSDSSYQNWREGEPNGGNVNGQYNDERCVTIHFIYPYQPGEWNDNFCNPQGKYVKSFGCACRAPADRT